jgi:hypothetical protein
MSSRDMSSPDNISASQKALFEYSKALAEAGGKTGKLEKRLVVREGHVAFDKISATETIRAFFGKGPASFKSVTDCCIRQRVSCQELGQRVSGYNINRAAFKQIDSEKYKEIQEKRLEELENTIKTFPKSNSSSNSSIMSSIPDKPKATEIFGKLEQFQVTREELQQLTGSNKIELDDLKYLLDVAATHKIEAPATVSSLIGVVGLPGIIRYEELEDKPEDAFISAVQYLVKHALPSDFVQKDKDGKTFIGFFKTKEGMRTEEGVIDESHKNLMIKCFDGKMPASVLSIEVKDSIGRPIPLIRTLDLKQIEEATSKLPLEEFFVPVYRGESLYEYSMTSDQDAWFYHLKDWIEEQKSKA